MLDLLTPLAHEAGALALAHFGRLPAAAIAAKGPLDLVTAADHAVEALISARLRAAFPDDALLGEEGGLTPGTSGRTWVIDPIDGTFNFVRGGRQWAVSIGLHAQGQPRLGIVHAPAAGLTVAGGPGHPPRLNGRPLPPLGPFLPDRAAVGLALVPAVAAAERLALLRRLVEGPGDAGSASAGSGVGGPGSTGPVSTGPGSTGPGSTGSASTGPGSTGPGSTGSASAGSGMKFRCCNASTMALLEVATGEVDGHIGLGERAWDVLAMWPILTALGAVSTLDWAATPLDARLRFVIGKPGLVAACRGMLP